MLTIVEMLSTFTPPSDGSAPRTITIRINDLRQEPNELWSVAVDVLGFKTNYHTRAYGADWLNAIGGAVILIRELGAAARTRLRLTAADPTQVDRRDSQVDPRVPE